VLVNPNADIMLMLLLSVLFLLLPIQTDDCHVPSQWFPAPRGPEKDRPAISHPIS